MRRKFSEKYSCIEKRKNGDFYGDGDSSWVKANFLEDYGHPGPKQNQVWRLYILRIKMKGCIKE